jgi:hypothetical protein
LTLGGPALWPIVCVAAFGCVAAAGAAPLSYVRRAWVVAAMGACAALSGLAMRLGQGGSWREAWIAAAIGVLAVGLFYRGAHRASRDARALVAVGVVLAVGWLGESLMHGVGPIGPAMPAWAYWSSMALRVGLGVVLLLSLLAFMHEGTTAGCSVWGAIAAGWLAAYEALQVAVSTRGGEGWTEIVVPAAGAAALAIGVGLAAAGAAQVLESRAACAARPVES